MHNYPDLAEMLGIADEDGDRGKAMEISVREIFETMIADHESGVPSPAQIGSMSARNALAPA